jgi:hypothetical protein
MCEEKHREMGDRDVWAMRYGSHTYRTVNRVYVSLMIMEPEGGESMEAWILGSTAYRILHGESPRSRKS